jgi:hypothetical protein
MTLGILKFRLDTFDNRWCCVIPHGRLEPRGILSGSSDDWHEGALRTELLRLLDIWGNKARVLSLRIHVKHRVSYFHHISGVLQPQSPIRVDFCIRLYSCLLLYEYRDLLVYFLLKKLQLSGCTRLASFKCAPCLSSSEQVKEVADGAGSSETAIFLYQTLTDPRDRVHHD